MNAGFIKKMTFHPLDPLLPNEISEVVRLTKKLKNLSPNAKFMSLGNQPFFVSFLFLFSCVCI